MEEEDLFISFATNRNMAPIPVRPPNTTFPSSVNWSHVGAGAAAGFVLPNLFGFGGGGASPVGQVMSLLPLLIIGGGGLYAYSVLKK
jgi:hypothetical protein